MSSKNYEVNGYGLDLNLITISLKSSVSYPRRCGLVGKSNQLRPIYLNQSKNIPGLSKKQDARLAHL